MGSKQLQVLEKEYESALRKLLHSQKNLPAINPKKKASNASGHIKKITDMEQYNLWKKKTNVLRTKYELKRYDHCNTLNAVINRHRYELILNLCACFSGFETFFHVGYEASLAHKAFHRSIQMGVAEKTRQEDRNDVKLKKIRSEIESVLIETKDYFKEKKEEKLRKSKLKRQEQLKGSTEQKNEDSDDSESEQDDPYNVDVYSGYLWKQSSNMKKDWKRRWFVLENGELAYYRSRNKLDREFVVNTMLCKVKEKLDHDYRYVFELISPSRRVYMLQAENEKEFIAWCSVLRNQVHRLLRQNQDNDANDADDHYSQRSKSVMEQRQKKRDLKRQISEDNRTCADCNKRDPEWVSINTGVVICIACCGVHRGLGTHISKVRSLLLDDIPQSTLNTLSQLGNDKINKILEHTIPSDYSTLNYENNPSIQEKEKYIKGKYMFKMFINPEIGKNKKYEEINEELYKSAVNNNLLGIFEALCYGANIDYQFDACQSRTALHETALANYLEATEFLLQNGASQNIEDEDAKTPRELAESNECSDVVKILDYHVGYDAQSPRFSDKEKKETRSPSNGNLSDENVQSD